MTRTRELSESGVSLRRNRSRLRGADGPRLHTGAVWNRRVAFSGGAAATVEEDLKAVAAVRHSGMGTSEESFYPAVNALLAELGRLASPPRAVLAHSAGLEGNLPDVALDEKARNVLVLLVEVKAASRSLDALARSAEALRYARLFGGGIVLLTQVREFTVARRRGRQAACNGPSRPGGR